MGTCRIPAVIIAVAIGGVGLAACGTSGSTPAAVPSAAANSASALAQGSPSGAAPTSALTDTPSSSPSASRTHRHSTAVRRSVTATTDPASSAHVTLTPHAISSSGSSGATHNFTVPAIPGENVVEGWGSYTKIGTARVKVTMCAKQTGSAFSVGNVALAYTASGSSQNLGATILTGPGNETCVTNTFIFYTAHLKVHAFIGGSNGTIIKTGPVLTLY
jgi:hypothetical protein